MHTFTIALNTNREWIQRGDQISLYLVTAKHEKNAFTSYNSIGARIQWGLGVETSARGAAVLRQNTRYARWNVTFHTEKLWSSGTSKRRIAEYSTRVYESVCACEYEL